MECMDLQNLSNGETLDELPTLRIGAKMAFCDEIDSNCSTPYVSAPSSPGRNPNKSYFFSAPASPMHYVLTSSAYSVGPIPKSTPELLATTGSFEFDGADPSGSMISADELFLNGQIRPMKLYSHLQRPQSLEPLLDLNEEDEEEPKEEVIAFRGREMRLRSRSVHRRARSMSPMRVSRFWQNEEEEGEEENKKVDPSLDLDQDQDPKEENEAVTPSESSASSSRSSSTGRNSKRWIFLKDLLYRSKSEGRGRSNGKEKEKFWHSISFSPAKEKEKSKPPSNLTAEPRKKEKPKNGVKKPTNGAGKRRGPLPSAHERHYTANRAQAEEMRKRTFLPYRQGLLGCLSFSSRGYGAVNGLARTLNPVSSR